MADVAREVDDGAPDLALPHVHPDELPGVTRDLQQDGRLATARGSAADLLDQPGNGQLADHVRDGGPGEVRPARDVRPTDGPETRQGAHHQSHVVLPRPLVCRLDERSHAAMLSLPPRPIPGRAIAVGRATVPTLATLWTKSVASAIRTLSSPFPKSTSVTAGVGAADLGVGLLLAPRPLGCARECPICHSPEVDPTSDHRRTHPDPLQHAVDEAARLLHADGAIAYLLDEADGVAPLGRRRRHQRLGRAGLDALAGGAPRRGHVRQRRRGPGRADHGRLPRGHHVRPRLDDRRGGPQRVHPVDGRGAAHQRGRADGRPGRLHQPARRRSASGTPRCCARSPITPHRPWPGLGSSTSWRVPSGSWPDGWSRRRTLRAITARIAVLQEPAEVLQRIVDESRRLLGADGAHLTLMSDAGDFLVPAVLADTTDAATTAWLAAMAFPLGGGINGLAASEGRVVWTPRLPQRRRASRRTRRTGIPPSGWASAAWPPRPCGAAGTSSARSPSPIASRATCRSTTRSCSRRWPTWPPSRSPTPGCTRSSTTRSGATTTCCPTRPTSCGRPIGTAGSRS